MIAEIDSRYLDVTAVGNAGNIYTNFVTLPGLNPGLPGNGLRFGALERVQCAHLWNTLFVKPGNGRDRAIGIVSEFRYADRTPLTMRTRQGKIQRVVEAEDVGTAFVIDDSRMISRGPTVRFHNHSLVLPGTGRAVAHGVSNAFGTTVRCIDHVVLAVPLIKPWSFLIVLRLGIYLYDGT